MTTRPMDLQRLLRPRSIALTGASAERASLGGAVLHNIQEFGFRGDIHLVSPTRKEINGAPCLPSLRDLPEGVDVAVLNVPRTAVRDAVSACIERNVGAAVVFAAGFAEADEAGRQAQDEISELCRAGGLALLGPNCLGLVNYAQSTPLTFESLERTPAVEIPAVAVVAQSGAMGANIRAALTARAIPVSHVVTTGNEAVLRIDHFIAHFVSEGATAIALYVEQIRAPGAFLEAARAAREAGVSIIMVHPGSSARGRAAAQSHTGAMTGDYALMKAAVQSEGVLLVSSMDELFDATALLHRFPKPIVGGVGVITNSGAVRGLSLDFCDTIGATITALSRSGQAETACALAAIDRG
ncbi:MAG: CoA-binding protein [Terricaulis sp.]|nr:CoA-binding protein [Terricaulis sp.]